MFHVAEKLYNLSFDKKDNYPVYHEDVLVYEVNDTKKNKFIGLFYVDLFPREGKQSGAWMTNYKDQYGELSASIDTFVNNVVIVVNVHIIVHVILSIRIVIVTVATIVIVHFIISSIVVIVTIIYISIIVLIIVSGTVTVSIIVSIIVTIVHIYYKNKKLI